MREKIIIDKLGKHENVNVAELVSLLKVSDRTIRTIIKDLNKTGVSAGFKIETDRGKGYRLNIFDNNSYQKYYKSISELDKVQNSYQRNERVIEILNIILSSKGYVTIDSIAEELDYSRSTIIKDMEIVEKRLEFFKLKLERKSGYGLRIISDEFAIRKAISTYIYGHDGNLRIDYEDYQELFFKVKKVFLEEIVQKNIEISNLAINNLFLHLQILISRIDSNNFLESDEGIIKEDLEEFKDFYPIADKVIKVIEKELNKTVSQCERKYLASQILYKSKVFSKNNTIKEKVYKDIRDILGDIDKENSTEFLSDEELIQNLLMHLCALIGRVKSNTQLRNPYFEEVNSKYAAVVSLTVKFTNKFSEAWDLNLLKDEIAFIAIHFATHFEKKKLGAITGVKKIALVCPSEGGIGYLLKLKLERIFSNTIITTYTILQLNDVIQDKNNFVITNVDLEMNVNIPVFKINNLLDDEEIEFTVEKIENSLKGKGAREENIDHMFFQRKPGGKDVDYMRFLQEESDKLNSLGVVNEEFRDSVLLREKSLSTAYNNGIAGPHAMEMNSKCNVISVTIFEEPINWKDKKVSIVCLIAMKKGSLELHKEIGHKLFKAINNKELRDKIMKCSSKDELLQIEELEGRRS